MKQSYTATNNSKIVPPRSTVWNLCAISLHMYGILFMRNFNTQLATNGRRSCDTKLKPTSNVAALSVADHR